MDIHRHIFLVSGFENTFFFFSFHLRFSSYPVTTTIIWPTSDRIPHSLIFKRMQIKRIVDNIRALLFLIDKLEQRTWRKRKLMLNQVFHKLDNNKCKCTRAHVWENKGISIYICLYMKTFLKTGICCSSIFTTRLIFLNRLNFFEPVSFFLNRFNFC